MSTIERYEPSRDLCQLRAAKRLTGRRGRPMVRTKELFQAAREDAWKRPGAVRSWCGQHRPAMRKLALSRLPWERAFAARMVKIFRAATAILEEMAELFEREALEVEAAGEDFGQQEDHAFQALDDPDGEVVDLGELTAAEADMLSWATA